MMYFALVVSALQLLLVALIARKANYRVKPILGTVFLFLLVLVFAAASIGLFLPPVFIQSLLLCVSVLIWAASRAKPRYLLLFSCAATLVSFAVPGYFAFRQTQKLQRAFPYVSLDVRLPRITRRPGVNLPTTTKDRLTALETHIQAKDWLGSFREDFLRQIHEDAVWVFVSSPGFGNTRMRGMRESLLNKLPQDCSIPQPGLPSASPWMPDELQKETRSADPSDELPAFHLDSVADFLNPAGFGYFKDRQHVAGFLAHQFSKEPVPARSRKLQRLELIGLVLHERPTVYISENLPRMKELRNAPTRDLDDFESAGMLALQRGEDLFIRERNQELRMLGSIRAASQCLSCHQTERGELLGAFSYCMSSP